MATRGETLRVEQEQLRAKKHAPAQAKVPKAKGHHKGERHPSKAAAKTASYGWEESAAKRPSRKSTRGSAKHMRPDVGLGQAVRSKTAAPRTQATRARVSRGTKK